MQNGQITVCCIEWTGATLKLAIEQVKLDREAAQFEHNATQEHILFWFVSHKRAQTVFQELEKASLDGVNDRVSSLKVYYDLFLLRIGNDLGFVADFYPGCIVANRDTT